MLLQIIGISLSHKLIKGICINSKQGLYLEDTLYPLPSTLYLQMPKTLPPNAKNYSSGNIHEKNVKAPETEALWILVSQ